MYIIIAYNFEFGSASQRVEYVRSGTNLGGPNLCPSTFYYDLHF